MGQVFYFEIPPQKEAMAWLVEAIPNAWQWVDGYLSAPEGLDVARETGFQLSRYSSAPNIVAPTGKVPDFLGIMVLRKPPAFMCFEEAGYESKSVPVELVKKIAVEFLLMSYSGHLTFFKSCHRNSKYENSARCSMIFQSWGGAPFQRPEDGEQPARVKLEWSRVNRGSLEDIEPILKVCRSLGLREYVPESKVPA
jgi:hypothetical protein